MIITIEEYAKKCDVSRQTIYNRIKTKHNPIIPIIDKSMGYEVQLIDTDIYPPSTERRKSGRKKFILK